MAWGRNVFLAAEQTGIPTATSPNAGGARESRCTRIHRMSMLSEASLRTYYVPDPRQFSGPRPELEAPHLPYRRAHGIRSTRAAPSHAGLVGLQAAARFPGPELE